jgi:hypothetical protein
MPADEGRSEESGVQWQFCCLDSANLVAGLLVALG